MKFSIIIPAYNSRNYIENAIQSVLAQSYHDYELIIVNDGSTDDTEAVIQKYLTLSNIIYISKQNGGVSSARNIGLKAATGEYIIFLDADDCLNPALLETVAPYCDQYDLVCYRISGLPENEQVLTIDEAYGKAIDICIETFQHDFFLGELRWTISYSPCNKAFKHSRIEDLKLLFDEELCVGEDMLFVYHYTKCCTRIFLLDNVLYYYVRRSESATQKKDFNYLPLYEKTYSKLKQFMDTRILSGWGLDFSKEILVNSYYCGHGVKKFHKRMNEFRKSNIYSGLVKAYPSGKAMKLYWFLLSMKLDVLLYLVVSYILRKKERHG